MNIVDSKTIEGNIGVALLVDISFPWTEYTSRELGMVGDGVEALLGAAFFVQSNGKALVGTGLEDRRSSIDVGEEDGHDGGCEGGCDGDHFV